MTLRELLKENRIPQQLVADALGISQSGMYRYDDLSKRSIEEVITISKATGLSISILLGDKFVDELLKNSSENGRPYYEDIKSLLIDFAHGKFKSKPDNSLYCINYPPFYDCQFYLLHKGDSMSPIINTGDVIALYYIDDMSIIQWGEPHLIVMQKNDALRAFVYLVYPGSDDKTLILRASNKNYQGDITIDKEDVYKLFLIKGKITRFQIL